MDGALFTLTALMVAGLFGFLWYLLNRQASRIDGLDGRLREVEEGLARLDTRFATFEASLAKVLDTVQDIDTRLARLEGASA